MAGRKESRVVIPSIRAMKSGEVLKDNGWCRVVRGGDGWIYKEADTNWKAYRMYSRMGDYVPVVLMLGDVLVLEDLGDQAESWRGVTDVEEWMSHLPLVLDELRNARIRHGDLTNYAVFVRRNKPVLIDFAESLDWDDPKTDKRPEGDEYWLTLTMKWIATQGIIEREEE